MAECGPDIHFHLRFRHLSCYCSRPNVCTASGSMAACRSVGPAYSSKSTSISYTAASHIFQTNWHRGTHILDHCCILHLSAVFVLRPEFAIREHHHESAFLHESCPLRCRIFYCHLGSKTTKNLSQGTAYRWPMDRLTLFPLYVFMAVDIPRADEIGQEAHLWRLPCFGSLLARDGSL